MISRSEIDKLSPEEKLDLLQAVWDSFLSNPDSLPVSEAEKRELQKRALAHQLNPEAALSEVEFRRQLDQRLGLKK